MYPSGHVWATKLCELLEHMAEYEGRRRLWPTYRNRFLKSSIFVEEEKNVGKEERLF